MQTRAAVVEAKGEPFTMTEVELDEPRDDEVLVRMVATGLCHTDITMGSFLPEEMFPNVFGHEGAGVVERVGAGVRGLDEGDHVVMSFRSCRDCAKCRAGQVGYCDQTLLLNYMGMRMDGSTSLSRDGRPVFGNFFGQSSLAAHALAYAGNCVKVDAGLDLRLLAPYGCGFQTGAGTVLNVLRPGTDDSLVVYGVGAVGLAAIAAAGAEGRGSGGPPRPPPRASGRSSRSTRSRAGARSPRSSAPRPSTPVRPMTWWSGSRSSPAAVRLTRSTPPPSPWWSSRPSSLWPRAARWSPWGWAQRSTPSTPSTSCRAARPCGPPLRATRTRRRWCRGCWRCGPPAPSRWTTWSRPVRPRRSTGPWPT